MPRRSKGARLWRRPASDSHTERFFILDSGRQISIGSITQAEAERALADYIGVKHHKSITGSKRDPERIPVSDVLALYATDIAPKHAKPADTAGRIDRLIAFFGERMLSEINGALCREFTNQSSTDTTARRDLEDLRAAINHHRREGLHDRLISVAMPDRHPSRERWLTRDEVAKLLWTAWRRPQCRHLARFVLVALYTGRRAAVVLGASFERQQGRPWVDLQAGFLRPPERAKVTNKRNPPIPLPEKLLIHLRAWRRNGQRYVIERGRQPMRTIEALKRVAIDAGLGDQVTPHVLRHTAATWQMQAGVNIFEASRYLGLTVATLERVYAHHAPDHLVGARDMHLTHKRSRPRLGHETNATSSKRKQR
jgi:integrase